MIFLFFSRCHLFKILQPNFSKTAVYGPSKIDLARLDDVGSPQSSSPVSLTFQYMQHERDIKAKLG